MFIFRRGDVSWGHELITSVFVLFATSSEGFDRARKQG